MVQQHEVLQYKRVQRPGTCSPKTSELQSAHFRDVVLAHLGLGILLVEGCHVVCGGQEAPPRLHIPRLHNTCSLVTTKNALILVEAVKNSSLQIHAVTQRGAACPMYNHTSVCSCR